MAGKTRSWDTPGSETLLSPLPSVSKGDELPAEARGLRGVKEERRCDTHSPRFLDVLCPLGCCLQYQ